MDVAPDLVYGDVDEGYGAVADAFCRNFAERGEIGAACVVHRDGRKVVDLWGGYRDGVARKPWASDTVVTMFSTSKGVAAATMAVAHARGLLDHDRAVADYWPEFAQAGKEHVTVRQLLSHQAGLAVIDRPLSVTDLADRAVMADALAAQTPNWAPGSRHGYRGISLGWYEGELLRRIDSRQRTLGRFFAEEIAGPLQLDFFFDLPADLDPDRRAVIHGWKPAELVLHLRQMPPAFVLGFLNPRSLTGRAFTNPAVLGVIDNYNRPDVLTPEIPAANGTGEVRAVSRLYGELATGGAALGLDPASLEALTRPAAPPSGGTKDLVLGVDTHYSLGYIKPFPQFRFGSSAEQAFGTMGTGGSFGFADPDTRIGFAYAMNRTGFRLWDDPRELALRNALYVDVLGERPQLPD
ncbi:CubicO group peptidase (beta-lactamase class C family) [Geodermatophilus bullaregiensis]|uniref:serine hydrolase domain-containing protein n=1 Tax=Geodermatophilus bullaregiensis TaxID=1564160 RepID=UPI00195BAA05|nr:serine hydrolase domain-containing protein [Geodermatophilus bullaregiensis]MBM7805025.1 CubicO group peptidase (beta-lactamase class C family) [Geodermatophilus bullaregiensis]